jgi:hypothetical protein
VCKREREKEGERERERERERVRQTPTSSVTVPSKSWLRGRDMLLVQQRGGGSTGVRGKAREQRVEGMDGLQARGE